MKNFLKKSLVWLLLLAVFTLSAAPAKGKSASKKKANTREKKAVATQVATPAGWLTDPVKAKAESAKSKRPILVLVSGPSWHKPSMTLQKKMIESKSFKNNVAKSAILLFVNVPKGGTAKIRNFKALYPFIKGGDKGLPILAVAEPDLKKGNEILPRTIFQVNKAIDKLKNDLANRGKEKK